MLRSRKRELTDFTSTDRRYWSFETSARPNPVMLFNFIDYLDVHSLPEGGLRFLVICNKL